MPAGLAALYARCLGTLGGRTGMEPSRMIINIPGQYAKFITALAGEAIAYVQLYGTTWHLEPALVMLGAALAVLGVPNTAPPAPPPPVTRTAPGNVTITPPPPSAAPK